MKAAVIVLGGLLGALTALWSAPAHCLSCPRSPCTSSTVCGECTCMRYGSEPGECVSIERTALVAD